MFGQSESISRNVISVTLSFVNDREGQKRYAIVRSAWNKTTTSELYCYKHYKRLLLETKFMAKTKF